MTLKSVFAATWCRNLDGGRSPLKLPSPRVLTNMSTLLQNLNLRVDDLTILLILIAATLFLLTNLYRPLALVHPIVLGRQSDVSRARYPKESAVYRNYGTGLVGRVSFILSFAILGLKLGFGV